MSVGFASGAAQEMDLLLTVVHRKLCSHAIGFGAAYRFPDDKLTISMDVTRREWDQFLIHDPRNRQINRRRISGVTGLPPDQHDVDPIYTVRIGAEYVFVNDKKAIQNSASECACRFVL